MRTISVYYKLLILVALDIVSITYVNIVLIKLLNDIWQHSDIAKGPDGSESWSTGWKLQETSQQFSQISKLLY